MRLVNPRRPGSIEELTPLEAEQLRITGIRFDGVDRPAALRFVDQPLTPEAEAEGLDWDDGNLAVQLLSVWEVHDDAGHRYDVWLHHGDAGTLFVAGTTEDVAGRVQFQWKDPALMDDWPDAAALDEAMRAAGV